MRGRSIPPKEQFMIRFRNAAVALLCLLVPAVVLAAEPATPAGHSSAAEPHLRATGETTTISEPAPPPKPIEPHKGKVLQVIHGGGYTFVYLKKKNNEK